MARLLIVDDNAGLLALWAKLFMAAGHQVSTASNITDGAALLRSERPQIVITDLRLPDAGDGLDFVRTVAGASIATDIVVIAGWPEEIRGRPEEKLITRLLSKPVHPAVLLRTVDELSRAA